MQPGDSAPDFEAPDQDGTSVHLGALRGRPVVLYFYPKADTPGCTTQACGIRDRTGEYAEHDATVIGVSPDEPRALRRFADKHGLEFTLVSDLDHAIADAYGVWAEKKMYGRTFWGNQRTTFVIDPQGTISHVFPQVSPKRHDDVVLAALGELGAAA